jgi:purine-binding chemotaxis protein CheW
MTKDEEAGANRAMWLICRVSTRVCALPLDAVVETMRPLVVEPVAGAPGFVSGLSIVRGEPIPVVDAARLLGTEVASPSRLVTLRAGTRRFALAVDAVLGVRALDPGSLAVLPPLLDELGDVVTAIGTLDAQLLLVLRASRLVPESVFEVARAARETRGAR